MKKEHLTKSFFALICIIGFCLVQSQRSGCSSKRHNQEVFNTEDTDLTKHHDTSNKRQASATIVAPLTAAPIDGEIVLKREGYTVSYNPTTLQPNYVCWALNAYRLDGDAKRTSFSEDPELSDEVRSRLDDYKYSGFSRGHMCPAADNKWSQEAMDQSFLLSNICPQTQTLNGGDWEDLESACRRWAADEGVTLYIACGPIFEGAKHRKLHKRVVVPEKFFKTVMCLDKGRERGIAFVYSNNTESHPMSYYVCTIDSVEQLTGYDLYHTVSKSTQDKLEATANLHDWQ